MKVIDVSNPSAPREIGGVDTPGDAMGIAVSDTIAYIADDELANLIFTCRSRSSPTTSWRLPAPETRSRSATF